jgi:predicted transcriptional regulator
MCNGKIYAGVYTELQRSCAKGKITLDMDEKNSKIIANLQVKGQTNSTLKESVTTFLKRHFNSVEVSIVPLPRFQCMFDKHMIIDKSL